MGTTRTRKKKTGDGNSRIVAIADAHLAAATCERLAILSRSWCRDSGIGHDDAHEVMLAAHRARMAAQEAENAETEEAAWAAVTTAREADARISEAIVDRLIDS